MVEEGEHSSEEGELSEEEREMNISKQSMQSGRNILIKTLLRQHTPNTTINTISSYSVLGTESDTICPF